MKYSNLEIYKELKYIDNCFSWKWRKVIDDIAKEIYKTKKVWLTNYLVENKYVNMNNTVSWIIVPFISPYWRDFLKKNRFLLWYDDYKNVFIFILTIVWTFAGIIWAYYWYLSYIK